MKTARTALALFACSLLLAGSGCTNVDVTEPIYEIPDEKYVVIYPAKEQSVESAWDSRLGHEIASSTAQELAKNVDFHVIPYGDVMEVMVAPVRNKKSRSKRRGSSDEEIGLDVRRVTPGMLAKLTGSNYVIVTEIKRFTLRDPMNINMDRGRATLMVKIFKVSKGKKARKRAKEERKRQERIEKVREKLDMAPRSVNPYGGKFVASKEIKANYPDDFLNQYGDVFMDPVKLRNGLIYACAKKISKLLYAHTEEPMPGEGR